MNMNKFLALLPVVAFAAGCNGVVPGGPNAVGSNDASDMASGDATTMARANCAGITGISLRLDGTNDAMLWVEAIYQFGGPVSTPAPQPRCAAPVWRSDHAGLNVDKANPFRAGFSRMETGKATLQATAFNGVHNAIQLDLTPGNSGRRPSACNDVIGVTLARVPYGDDSRVAVLASYQYSGPLSTPCTVAPALSADRRGLVVDEKNPFLASIIVSDDVMTTVTAKSPSGAVGTIVF